jgi:NADH dehydrogenase
VDKGVMATIGRSRAVAETLGGRLRMSGLFAWLAWLFIHIWFLIDFRNRVSVLLNWFWAYITYRRGARLITGPRPWELLRDQALRRADSEPR